MEPARRRLRRSPLEMIALAVSGGPLPRSLVSKPAAVDVGDDGADGFLVCPPGSASLSAGVGDRPVNAPHAQNVGGLLAAAPRDGHVAGRGRLVGEDLGVLLGRSGPSFLAPQRSPSGCARRAGCRLDHQAAGAESCARCSGPELVAEWRRASREWGQQAVQAAVAADMTSSPLRSPTTCFTPSAPRATSHRRPRSSGWSNSPSTRSARPRISAARTGATAV